MEVKQELQSKRPKFSMKCLGYFILEQLLFYDLSDTARTQATHYLVNLHLEASKQSQCTKFSIVPMVKALKNQALRGGCDPDRDPAQQSGRITLDAWETKNYKFELHMVPKVASGVGAVETDTAASTEATKTSQVQEASTTSRTNGTIKASKNNGVVKASLKNSKRKRKRKAGGHLAKIALPRGRQDGRVPRATAVVRSIE
ncbi:hypothetical protein LTR09_005881 [Extremus antarcticus]|uniref:Uncharacterized protein n=1 Tax=Extremus antarcticus TaxID=702011 RepID=A0AAJ0GC38_9PEZI|nr:hypothetical protein LTR09_005881 [Extremus antarcticus]